MTAVTRRVLVGLLLASGAVGCASDPKPGAPRERSLTELTQAVDTLRREVDDLASALRAYRSVGLRELSGLREEVQAVQSAIQALVRDSDQRHMESIQAVDRRLAAVGARLEEIASRLQRAEAVASDRPPARPAEEPAAAPRPPAAAPPAPPAPAAPPVLARPPGPAAPPPAAAPPGTLTGALAGRPTLRRVSAADAGGETRVVVEADGPVTPRVLALADPPRVILDFENTAFGFGRSPVVIGGPILERIRFIQIQASPVPVIRVLLQLARPTPHWVEPQPRGLVVHLGSAGPRR
jgi:hypothetical protein